MSIKNAPSKTAKVVAIQKANEPISIKLGETTLAIIKGKADLIAQYQNEAKKLEVSINEIVATVIEYSGNKAGAYTFDAETNCIILQ